MPSDDQDRTKLHAEINQAVNQRFLLTAGGISAFVLLAKELFPELPLTCGTVYRATAVEIAMLLLLLLLYYQSTRLRLVMRIYTTYLRAKGWSVWEDDWAALRNKPCYKQDTLHDLRGHSMVFLTLFTLVFVSTAYIAASIYYLQNQPVLPNLAETILFSILASTCIGTMCGIVWVFKTGFRENESQENKFKNAWDKIEKEVGKSTCTDPGCLRQVFTKIQAKKKS
ncbi:MAG TPA: hypothetical protein PK667_03150 [Nitrosomonas europaea]|uniref:hypothetical protein n=1 Tax=Nitrosomonas europaea TaxID=915 RepID=UPI002492D495|nr:hypothetical protein [Nitrosomonas europaea]HRN80942.1 hypothetical protein [Nitrosomonas europaea]HRO55573.1 hypothetical protein [Nitrosomonas europaea]HRQ07408.1 hypothetical protein [Nitrosomonas europaea]HUM73183.1 hypothetical protein [Nitrosomonas europaea]